MVVQRGGSMADSRDCSWADSTVVQSAALWAVQTAAWRAGSMAAPKVASSADQRAVQKVASSADQRAGLWAVSAHLRAVLKVA
jgi:hypothetical protein